MELKLVPRQWLTAYLSSMIKTGPGVGVLEAMPPESARSDECGDPFCTNSITRSLIIDVPPVVREPARSRVSARAIAVDLPLRERVLAEISRISEMTDPIVRNLHITESYHHLSIELSGALGCGDANWCTFAKWASARAGRTIRKEDAPSLRHAAHAARPGAGILVDVALSQASLIVARGNRKVYLEMAPLFVRFVALCDAHTQPDLSALDAFLAEEMRRGRSERDGQDLLKVAFRNYYEAKFEASRETRSGLIALANAQVGLHVQIRLQREVAGRMTPGGRLLASRALLTPRLPEETLGSPHGTRTSEGRSFSVWLEQAASADLKRVLFGAARPLEAATAGDPWEWMELADRLSNIYDLFRRRQQDVLLMNQAALTWQQRQQMAAAR